MIRLTTALTLSLAALGSAEARPVTFTIDMKPYGGNAAYAAVYVTDAAGAYQGTLWLAAGKAKWWPHLSDWYAATNGNPAEIDGVTGASVGSGRTLTVTADLADALFDAGYEVRVDTAVEDYGDKPAEVRVPLTKAGAGAGQATAGRGFVKSFRYE